MKNLSSAPLSVLSLEVEGDQADSLSRWLASSLRVQPVQFERPGHPFVWIEVYLGSDTEAAIAAKVLATRRGVRAVQTRQCEPRDWQSFWHHHFQAQDIGARLHIRPPWEPASRSHAKRINMVIDPGLSFGTGGHFTTRFCLEMLEKLFRDATPVSLLDAGTGSGILAIAAASMGCRRVIGIDNDPQALDHARRNAKLNGMSKRIEWRRVDIARTLPREKFDILCANLYSRILIERASGLLRCARQFLVISGFREDEADLMADIYVGLGCRQLVRDGEGEWGGLVFLVS